VREDGPRLDLLDETGKRRAMLTVTKDGPALVLLDETGKVIRSYP
jgi:phage regulator Rha-like protein